MSIKLPWDKYEAAILLDALLQVKNGIPKAYMVNLVSFRLWQKAINQNIEIDEIYRNTNGISFQMKSMKSAYKQVNMGISATKIFTEIANLYRNDYESYAIILEEAMRMAEYSSALKEDFLIYLKQNHPQIADRIIKAITAMEEFAIANKILSQSIYENLSTETLTILKKKVISHKAFTARYKYILKDAELGLQLLDQYAKNDSPFNETSEKTEPLKPSNDSGNFYDWMVQHAGLSLSTARIYKSAIKSCDTYAHKNELYQGSIFDCKSYDNFMELYTLLMNNDGFRKMNEEKHGYLAAGLKKYRDYIFPISTKAGLLQADTFKKAIPEDLAKKCETILMQEFEDGYCIGDYMHQMRFQLCYAETHGEELGKTGDELDCFLKNIGQIRGERIFCVNIENNTVLSSIYADMTLAFDNGATAIYYECLYEKYEDKLAAEMSVYSVDALKAVIVSDSEFLSTKYQSERAAITKQGINADTNLEIRQVLQDNHVPMTVDDIKSKLWYIPNDRIKLALVQIPEAAHVDEATYFYAPNFYISSEEKIALIYAMRSAIASKGYIVAKNLRKIFRNTCPSAAIDSENFKDHGIREILKVILQDDFDFSSSVITEKGNTLDYGQIYQNYATQRDRLTLNELNELKKELGISVIYWESIFKEMIRISSTELVRKSTVHFDVEAVDEVLEQMYPNEYTALKDFTLFLSLPPASVRWNGFVLESYLREYSKKFRLIQLSIAQDDYFGVMLRCSSDLDNYNDVAADMLARNDSWSDEKSALRLLVDMKFQQRAKNNSIAAIIKAAKQKRLNLQ